MRFRRQTPVVEDIAEEVPPSFEPEGLPWTLRGLGTLLLLGTGAFAVLRIRAHTWLAWHFGPALDASRGVAFDSLGGWGLFGGVAVILSLLWMLLTLVLFGARVLRRSRPAPFDVFVAAAFVVVLGVCAVPTSAWRALTFAVAGPGPHAAAHLTHEAAQGESGVVRTLLWRGAPPNALGPRGRTPLTAAVESGDRALIRALLLEGADPARADAHGRTPRTRADQLGYGDELFEGLVD